jgi:predicted ArsR family transcriptional regulator
MGRLSDAAFGGEPYVPNYRHTDPVTSKEAGEAAKSFTGEMHEKIMGVMRQLGRPLAAEEIASWSGLNHVQVGKRMAELERAGRVTRTTERHRNASGRGAFRYRLAAGQSGNATATVYGA